MTFESMGRERLRIKNEYIRDFLAEFSGTFVLIIFGCGTNAQCTLSKGSAGEFLTVNWGWGMGIAMGVWVAGGASGGHINPAVTLAMVIIGKLKARKLIVYWFAQYLGAFVASAIVYGVYYDALNNYDGGIRSIIGPNATAGIWGTYPQSYLETRGGFVDQLIGTMMLLICAMAITDSNNMSPPKGMVPFCIGMIVFAISLGYGFNCGFALNPARDLGPRIFTACAGWGADVFKVYNYWFWVPIVAPHVGAILGALLYLLFVSFHLEDESENSYDIDRKLVSLRAVDTSKSNDSAQF